MAFPRRVSESTVGVPIGEALGSALLILRRGWFWLTVATLFLCWIPDVADITLGWTSWRRFAVPRSIATQLLASTFFTYTLAKVGLAAARGKRVGLASIVGGSPKPLVLAAAFILAQNGWRVLALWAKPDPERSIQLGLALVGTGMAAEIALVGYLGWLIPVAIDQPERLAGPIGKTWRLMRGSRLLMAACYAGFGVATTFAPGYLVHRFFPPIFCIECDNIPFSWSLWTEDTLNELLSSFISAGWLVLSTALYSARSRHVADRETARVFD